VTDPTITHVTGGAFGPAATYAAVLALADAFDVAGSELRDWTGLGVRTMADPDLAASAVWSPVTFAIAEVTVLAATTGPDGVLVESLGWEADAVLVRGVVAGFETTDGLVRAWMQPLDQALVEHAFGATDPQRSSALVALAYGSDGHPSVHRVHVDVPSSQQQPADLAGLVRQLQHVAALSHGSDSPLNGTIEIQTIGAGTGGVRHIVYLPGTDDMTTLPWTHDGDVRDLATDLLLMAGEDNSYQQGILDAMAQAGIGPHDPVLLVGHSQGGMEAAAILGHDSHFNVTHVVTAGSPTAQVPGFPDGSHVLSLEHEGDIVPLTDGLPNPDSVQQVTVSFTDDAGPTGIVGMHDYDHYVAGAAAADASSDPSVLEQLASLHENGFLAPADRPAPEVTSQVFQVVREP
jgi:hypothetical protein